jgi:hypothetical protein
VVHEHVNLLFACDLANCQRIIERNRKRLLHHHRHAVVRADFDHAPMIGNGCVGQQRLWAALLNHFGRVLEEEVVGEPVLLLIFRLERRIELRNADKLNIVVLRQLPKESRNVIVHQAHNGNTQRTLRRSRPILGIQRERQQKK